MKNQNEEWRVINGYEKNYEVSNLGRVRRFNLIFKVYKILAPSLNINGFFYVSLKKSPNYKHKRFSIHNLVAIAFIDPHYKPSGNKTVRHINLIKTDNRLENIYLQGRQ